MGSGFTERHQLWMALTGIAAGLALGLAHPGAEETLAPWAWLALAALLYTTFCPMPLLRAIRVDERPRFMAGLLVTNFLCLPVVSVGLVWWLVPPEPALRLGILLVLLAPCTDWYIAFTHLGRGDSTAALGATPVLLGLQVIGVPFYLWLFLGVDVTASVDLHAVAVVFLAVIGLPLALAAGTQYAASHWRVVARLKAIASRAPVPLAAMALFLVTASQAGAMMEGTGELVRPAIVFLLYLALAALVARVVAGTLDLAPGEGRAVVFSAGTRNSFVVLPLALTLPDGAALAATIIVLQSLIELAVMTLWVRWVPEHLVPG